MHSRVERHSLCPVFTSLEFKWSTGRLRLLFTSHHLHLPLHTVHSWLLIRPHPSTLHNLSQTHAHTVQLYFHILSFLVHSTQTNKHIEYCINCSQPFTSADVHMAFTQHVVISCWVFFFFFLLEYPLFLQSTAINHPVITLFSLILTYTYMQRQMCMYSLQ